MGWVVGADVVAHVLSFRKQTDKDIKARCGWFIYFAKHMGRNHTHSGMPHKQENKRANDNYTQTTATHGFAHHRCSHLVYCPALLLSIANKAGDTVGPNINNAFVHQIMFL